MTSTQLSRLPQVLFEIGKAIGSDDDPGVLLGQISERICELVAADACSIMLLDPQQGRLMGKAAHGLSRGDIRGLTFRVGEGVAGWVAEHGEAALIHDVDGDDRFVELDGPTRSIRSMACVPLHARGERVGVLTATSGDTAAFDDQAIDLLEFIAKTIALDVENIRLLRLSVTDPLTGAFNREFLQQKLPDAMRGSAHRAEPLSLGMIDVDHFKPINDRLGHAAGDRVLAEVASRLRSAIRSDDLLVRYGGEEFLVVLPNTDAGAGREVGERMRARLGDQPLATGGEEVDVRISIGIAEMRTGEASPELLGRADAALYTAKRNGRDRVEVAA